MAITTKALYDAAPKQCIPFHITGTITATANVPMSLFGLTTNYAQGTLDAGNTANGLVPTDATAGYPTIAAFGGSAVGYITRACAMMHNGLVNISAYDRLFVCGAYNYNTDTTLASQPSYSSRVPGGDYKGLEIWVETVVAPTGNLAVQVNYTNQDGNPGDTGAVGIGAAPAIRRMWRLPLAAGDTGVQSITRVRGSVATVGASCFNVCVMRPLVPFIKTIPYSEAQSPVDMLRIGMPIVYDNSALFYTYTSPGSSGTILIELEIANG